MLALNHLTLSWRGSQTINFSNYCSGKNTGRDIYSLKSLGTQYGNVKYRHNVAQQISGIYSSCITETLNHVRSSCTCSRCVPWFWSPQIKSLTVSIVFHLFAMKWWDQTPWSLFFECWVLSQLFLFSFTFIKRLFSSLLTAMRVVSSAYLRLLVLLLAILIPACASSSHAFCKMYSAYELNKQGDNIQPWCIPFFLVDVAISFSYCILTRM